MYIYISQLIFFFIQWLIHSNRLFVFCVCVHWCVHSFSYNLTIVTFHEHIHFPFSIFLVSPFFVHCVLNVYFLNNHLVKFILHDWFRILAYIFCSTLNYRLYLGIFSSFFPHIFFTSSVYFQKKYQFFLQKTQSHFLHLIFIHNCFCSIRKTHFHWN